MIAERGTFSEYSDPARSGILMRNEDGVDWHHYVLSRVIFDSRGGVAKLFEHGSMTQEVDGDRFFANVVDGRVVFVADRDLSRLEPRGALVVETDQPIEAGMLYEGGVFKAAPPPPPAPIVREKSTVLNSFTDTQFELWDERFGSASARQRITWNNAPTFASDQDAWPTIRALFVHVFGEDVGKGFFPDHPTG